MQITLLCFKNDNLYCHSRNTSKNYYNYMNLTFKTEKEEMNYLNYSKTLWDYFGYYITQVGNVLPNQVGNILLNQTTLPYWAIGPDCSWELRSGK